MAGFVGKESGHNNYDGINVIVDKGRFFDNNFGKYQTNNKYLNETGNEFSVDFSARLLENRNRLLSTLLGNLENEEDGMISEDITVYTGIGGIALLFMKISSNSDWTNLEEKAKNKYLRAACKNTYYKSKMKKRPTFLCGLAGPLAIKAVADSGVANSGTPSNEAEALQSVNTLLEILPATLKTSSDLPNELLYGRAGYLYALLYVKKNVKEPTIANGITPEVIGNLTKVIIDEGVQYAKRTKRQVPMWWEWHEKEYIGGAHGVAGVLHTLLCAIEYIPEELIRSHLKPTLDYLVRLQFPSGNFPSSVERKSMPTNDKLLHFCHGAPGVIHLLLKAHEIWPNNEDSYLVRARRCGDTIWQRGLLKKGYGICHGVSGNTYAFIRLWNVTNEPEYLYKAARFAEWCFDYGSRGCRTPDRPLSLFEGIAGVIYMLTDLIQGPATAQFPAFCGI